jgi:hypothetical protein
MKPAPAPGPPPAAEPETASALRVEVMSSIAQVPAGAWDACAGDADPFVGHAFLSLLEDSHSACADSGWRPAHFALKAGDGRLLAVAPAYLKSHSYGEYVFDWGWADAFERAGGRYYPKLQVAVPFSPVPGPRLLVAADAPAGSADRLARAMIDLAGRAGLSSVHVTFAPRATCDRLGGFGFLVRRGFQFHWHNRGYRTFDDFLADLASRKRKAIRKERAEVAAAGLRIRALSGADIADRHWHAFYRFYLDTVARKGAYPYLTSEFFFGLSGPLGPRVLLVVAETPAGDPVAAALNLIGRDALYGRTWGCGADYRFLHFELCYYRAIEAAIERGLTRVEAGAQGQHKIQRGYLPEPTWSAHWIADPGFRRAVERFLAGERAAVEAQMEALAALSPFRKDGG